MIKFKKTHFIILILLIGTIYTLPSLLAGLNYDQTVYKVDSNYKEECSYQRCSFQHNHYYPNNYHTGYYSNYQLQKKSSYEKRYFEKNYIEKSYEKTHRGFLGTYVKEYTVEIKNTGRTGEYFIVNFKLRDKNDFEVKQSVMRYIKTGETEKFIYRDVQHERNEILSWDYSIEREN